MNKLAFIAGYRQGVIMVARALAKEFNFPLSGWDEKDQRMALDAYELWDKETDDAHSL